MNALLQESRRIKALADKILKESGVIEILSDYGEVQIAGSYALDVMLRPDIDLYVIAEKHDWNKVLDIQSKMMRRKYFRELYFMDWIKFENKQVGEVEEWIPSIKGYYFATVIPVEDQRFKMDIWLITPEYDYSTKRTDHFKALMDTGDQSKKIAILEIKQATREGKKYVKGVDGKFIYKAVLEDGVTGVEEFNKYLENQK